MRSTTVSFIVFLTSLLTSVSADQDTRSTPEQRFFDWSSPDFPPRVYAQRVAKLAEALRKSGGGVYLSPSRGGRSHGETFRQNNDFLYLTGLELPDSILAVDADQRRTILFVPQRDARFENPARRNDFPGRPLGQDPELAKRSGITDLRSIDLFDRAVADWLSVGRPLRVNPGHTGEIKRLETEYIYAWTPEQAMLHHLRQKHPKAQVKNAFAEITRLRMVKSPEEIGVLRRAIDATTRSLRHAARAVWPGVDERTLEAEFEAECKRQGSQRLAFDSIVKSGPNSLWPWRVLASHYDRRNRAMQAGDLVIFDVGCQLDHYTSDVGRTFPVSGTFTARQKKTLEMATAVADAIIAAVRPGVAFSDLKKVALEAIPDEQEKYMQTGLFYGHHIGLDVGDPSLADAPLEAGMVFTVEPWYYNHDQHIAVFVEDDVLVTEGGSENLSRALPRSAEGLEKLMRAKR